MGRQIPVPLRAFLFLLLNLSPDWASSVQAQSYIDLTAREFFDMASSGQVDLIMDVRSEGEWNSGHIENATLVANLGTLLSITPAEEINATLQQIGIYPCLQCTTIVYCRSGARAGTALSLLRTKAGFIGATFYNGQGTGGWTDAGYSLVDTPSYKPACSREGEVATSRRTCPRQANQAPIPSFTLPPSTLPPGTLAPANDAPQDPGVPTEKKEAPPAKCGSLGGQDGRGGAAAKAKDCSSRLRQRRQRQLKGL